MMDNSTPYIDTYRVDDQVAELLVCLVQCLEATGKLLSSNVKVGQVRLTVPLQETKGDEGDRQVEEFAKCLPQGCRP